MKKENLQKVLIAMVTIFVIFQFLTSKNKFSKELALKFEIIKYALFAAIIVISLIYAKKESSSLFSTLIKVYLILIPLYGLFKFRGVI